MPLRHHLPEPVEHVTDTEFGRWEFFNTLFGDKVEWQLPAVHLPFVGHPLQITKFMVLELIVVALLLIIFVPLARKARDGRLAIEDLSGGTFTITNGGVYGSLMSTPILNPPQSGILGMHKIERRPIAVGDKIEARPMMYLALSYDHRIVDGREAVTFLVRIKECVEEPSRILFDV
jgi:hypothetical protein